VNKGITIGMDMGDKRNVICVLDRDGNVMARCNIANTAVAMRKHFKEYQGATVAIEAGTHSGWTSRLLEELGCEVLIGNPRKVRAIYRNDGKSDEQDAEILARMARFDRSLLHPIHHRGERAQMDLEVIKARDILVQSRTKLVNHVRGAVKAVGGRIGACSAESFSFRAEGELPAGLVPALLSVLEMIQALTDKIRIYDKMVREMSKSHYPEAERISQISGVGPLTSVAYVLTLEEPGRFAKSRQVGPYLGLTPRRDQSGDTDKQLRITKAGNDYLRRLLVGCAHYIMGPFGPDSDLRRYGERIAKRGGKNAKRRAIVAVARKLAVLMHSLWKSGQEYEPLRKRCAKAA